jgi:hypothetical protein
MSGSSEKHAVANRDCAEMRDGARRGRKELHAEPSVEPKIFLEMLATVQGVVVPAGIDTDI